jgi:3-hydroxyisobutyrate dehydrogenase
MGAPMAHNLLKASYPVYVFDMSQTAVASLVEAGAIAATSLADLANKADTIITMLPAGEHVEQVCLGQAGLFAHAKPGTLFIDSSSIAVSTSRNLHQKANAQGMQMLDAPVSGGVAAAQAGTLTFMVGGEDKHYQYAKPILEAMGKKVIHAGQAGNGQAAKICNNMLLGISMIGVAEAFALSKKLGLDAKTFFDISSNASGQCWSMTSYCPVPDIIPTSPANQGYQPGFTAAMMLKDLRLSQNAAQSVGAATPLGAEATALYTLFTNMGQSQMDFSAIIKLIEGGNLT